MTDAELDVYVEFAAEDSDQTIAQLVAEVRRLRAELALATEAAKFRWNDVLPGAPLRWSMTPPGPEHEGRWFWVRTGGGPRKECARWSDGDWYVSLHTLLHRSDVLDWAGPIVEPEAS